MAIIIAFLGGAALALGGLKAFGFEFIKGGCPVCDKCKTKVA